METPLILVYYIAVGHLDQSDIHKYMQNIQESMKEGRGKDLNLLEYYIPIRTGETRIECINPVMVSEEEYAKVRATLERVEKAVADLG